ncbi:MAG TPA: TIGR03000 domain-containing protein [Gemmataceae bacterium]|nr:TIGR03000 domain-containing protein [Gemmataceae bacterium]
MTGFRLFSLKRGLAAVAGLVLAASTAQAGFGIVQFVGPRYGGVMVGPYGGVGYVRPGYFGGYGLYGRGYGGFGLGLGTGLRLGYGLGYGLGSGVYGYGVPRVGYSFYSFGYPAMNYGYGIAPYGSAGPYSPMKPPLNPDANPPPPRPQAPQQPMPEELPQVKRKENKAEVTVVVPESAELWFNGTKTTQKGPERKFVTPPLTPGEDFIYTVKARWMENGKPVEQTRPIHVQANSSQVIDFTK